MNKNNELQVFDFEHLCLDNSNFLLENAKIILTERGKVLVLFLSGTIIDKINILKNIKIPEDIPLYAKIGIYAGMVDSNIKKIAHEHDIKLVKQLSFRSSLYNIIIRTNDNKTKINFFDRESKRSKIQIEKEILEILNSREKMPITKIVYKCNLNYKYCSDLLNDLIKINTIEVLEEKMGIKYKITQFGREYLSNLKKLGEI